MKILFINQFFWPDSSATSQLLTDAAVELTKAGHDVSVLCADGGYATSAGATPPPVTIHRVRTFAFSRGKLGRFLSYLSFCVLAMLRALVLPLEDVVVTLTTPPLISVLGMVIKFMRGSQHFTWEQDLYPDVAIDLNVFRSGGLADRMCSAVADMVRRDADGIVVLGECTRERLISRGIEARKIVVSYNWADSRAIQPLPRTGDASKLVLLYSGNLGLAHDVETIQQTMLELREDMRFHFIFVGGGTGRAQLAEFCTANQIHSAEMRPYVPRDQLSEGLAIGDIGLVTQHDCCAGSVVPSKVYGIMAAGRPILFIGPKHSTPAYQIAKHGCGWQIDCGDVAGLRELLIRLASDSQSVREAGHRARQALLCDYDMPLAIKRLEKIFFRDLQTDGLNTLVGQPHKCAQ